MAPVGGGDLLVLWAGSPLLQESLTFKLERDLNFVVPSGRGGAGMLQRDETRKRRRQVTVLREHRGKRFQPLLAEELPYAN